MKLSLIGSALLLSVSVMATTDASADNRPVAQQATPAAQQAAQIAQVGQLIQFPWVKGTIHVTPSQATGNLAKVVCSDFSVIAESDETVPRPANLPADQFWSSPPVWSHSVKAQGTFSSGSCTYQVAAVAGKKFHVTLQGNFNPDAITTCQWLQLGSVTPAQRTSAFTLKAGEIRIQDWTVGQVGCGILH